MLSGSILSFDVTANYQTNAKENRFLYFSLFVTTFALEKIGINKERTQIYAEELMMWQVNCNLVTLSLLNEG